jgi:hypothetical protein
MHNVASPSEYLVITGVGIKDIKLSMIFKKMIEIGELVEGYICIVLGEWESLKKCSIC